MHKKLLILKTLFLMSLGWRDNFTTVIQSKWQFVCIGLLSMNAVFQQHLASHSHNFTCSHLEAAGYSVLVTELLHLNTWGLKSSRAHLWVKCGRSKHHLFTAVKSCHNTLKQRDTGLLKIVKNIVDPIVATSTKGKNKCFFWYQL